MVEEQQQPKHKTEKEIAREKAKAEKLAKFAAKQKKIEEDANKTSQNVKKSGKKYPSPLNLLGWLSPFLRLIIAAVLGC